MHQFNQNRLNYRVFKFCVVLVYFFFCFIGGDCALRQKTCRRINRKKRLVSHRMDWAKHHHCAPNRRQCFVKTTFYKQFGSIFLCSAISINRWKSTREFLVSKVSFIEKERGTIWSSNGKFRIYWVWLFESFMIFEWIWTFFWLLHSLACKNHPEEKTKCHVHDRPI